MKNWIIAFAVAVVVGGLAGWLLSMKDSPEEVPEVVGSVEPPAAPVEVGEMEPVAEEEVVAEEVPVPEPEVPVPEKLNDSDSTVAEVVAQLSPALGQWLLPEEQVRKWVLAVDMMAGGEVPRRHTPWNYPLPPFEVVPAGDPGAEEVEHFLAADNNDERLTAMLDAIRVIPPRTMGRYYRAWLPTLEQAYSELGKQGTFAERVDEAVARILAVPEAPEVAELERPHVFYQYSDPELEKQDALTKALWRAGEDNRKALQAYLRELRFYL